MVVVVVVLEALGLAELVFGAVAAELDDERPSR